MACNKWNLKKYYVDFLFLQPKISAFLWLPWSLVDWSKWNTGLAVLIAKAVETEIK